MTPTTKPPVTDRSPVQQELLQRRQAAVKAFFAKYPNPFVAWVERQRRQSVRDFWRVLNLELPMEFKVKMIAGLFGGREFQVPRLQRLWDCWFRAAVQELEDWHKRDEDHTLSVTDIAEAFHIPRSRYQVLVKAERAWASRHDPKAEVRRLGIVHWVPQMMEFPATSELITDLFFALNKNIS